MISQTALSEIVGADQKVPILGGRLAHFVNLDNAATTPPFKVVVERACEFLSWYASVHRGSGYKSLLSTKVLEDARQIIGEFVSADSEKDIVIFTGNTTGAINKLARRLDYRRHDMILISDIEHSSNELPWRKASNVTHFPTKNGELDLSALS